MNKFNEIARLNRLNDRLFEEYCNFYDEDFDMELWAKVRDNVVRPNNMRILGLLKEVAGDIKAEDMEIYNLWIRHIEGFEEINSPNFVPDGNKQYPTYPCGVDEFIAKYVGANNGSN